jgi:protein-disulfide isomerase
MNDEQFVTAHFQTLEPAAGWTPHPAAAWARIETRSRRRSFWTTFALATAAVILVAAPTPARCSIISAGCPRLLPAAAVAGYKETGSPSAPLTLEIYSDYECPYCAKFFTEVYPQFAAEFVKTGNVRVIHRDFPLPQHRYSKLAARYVNAAGELGYYDQALTQLFKTQQEWTSNGNIDAALARVLDPAAMQKIRSRVAQESTLDQTAATDLAAVAKDQINQIPSIVFVYKGRRQKSTAPQSIDLLRAYIKQLLAQ